MASQLKELRISSYIGLLLPLEEEQICKSSSIGHCVGIQDGLNMGVCPPHMATLLEQAEFVLLQVRRYKLGIYSLHMLTLTAAVK